MSEKLLRILVREAVSLVTSGDHRGSSNGYPHHLHRNVPDERRDTRVYLSEGMRYHINNRMDLDENVYRPGTREFFDLFNEARELYEAGLYEATDAEAELLESDIGRFGMFEGRVVPLDYPMWDESPVNETADKGSYSRGPGIVLSRLGGWSSKKQSPGSAPEKHGVWAFISPYFEPFLVGSTDDEGVTAGTRPSRYELMKRSKGKQPGLKLRKSRYIGSLYTRIEGIPNAVPAGGGWYMTDADALREYIFGGLRPREFADQAATSGIRNRTQMARYSKDHFEVFVPWKKGKFVGGPIEESKIIPEAEYKGREVQLGAKGAKRSGGRAHVYVRDPKSGKVKKISFGSGMPDAMGDSEAHRKRRKSFGDRHNCAGKKDKMKAGYWACRATKMFGRNIPGWW